VKFGDSGYLGCDYVDPRKNVDESDFAKLLVQGSTRVIHAVVNVNLVPPFTERMCHFNSL
jgi:hypothetical protein